MSSSIFLLAWNAGDVSELASSPSSTAPPGRGRRASARRTRDRPRGCRAPRRADHRRPARPARSHAARPGLARPDLPALAGRSGPRGAAAARRHEPGRVRRQQLGGPDPVPPGRGPFRHRTGAAVRRHVPRDQRAALLRRRRGPARRGVPVAGGGPAAVRARRPSGPGPELHLGPDARGAVGSGDPLHQPAPLAGPARSAERRPGAGHRGGGGRPAGRLPHRPLGSAHPPPGPDLLPAEHPRPLAAAAGPADQPATTSCWPPPASRPRRAAPRTRCSTPPGCGPGSARRSRFAARRRSATMPA